QGQQRKTTEIISERLQLGPRPGGGGAGGGRAGQSSSGDSPAMPAKEDVPTINFDEEGSAEIKPEDLPF
ncbi:MAG: hypothetical protein RIQ56_815, partial [Candidatus Parcubacteria bacterium]